MNTSSPEDVSPPDSPPATHALHPVVAFIIGLAIILGASLMNAGGLNLTKLDHSRQTTIPKASRRADWLRPLWLLGMLLYAYVLYLYILFWEIFILLITFCTKSISISRKHSCPRIHARRICCSFGLYIAHI